MKNYVASNAVTRCWWNGKAFSDEGPIAVIDAPTLAVLRATYENVMATEVVTLPTVTEAEVAEQEKASVLFAKAIAVNERYTKRLEEAIKHFEEKAEANYWRDAYNRLSDQREQDTDA